LQNIPNAKFPAKRIWQIDNPNTGNVCWGKAGITEEIVHLNAWIIGSKVDILVERNKIFSTFCICKN
jgi:hypothetical protein